MENFIVSARKYRPVSFNTVVGQESITTTLKNSIKNNHLAQAYLFCGPKGVGKTTCARIFAKTINCENITENTEACNECESCLSFKESRSFNIHELDAASNNTVDDIRNLIDQIRIPPQIGKYSIYIIDEVHMLSAHAFNAFLKTLEEPPRHAIFILATTLKQKIIPTILSRCQIFDYKRIKVDDIVKYLEFVAEKEKVETEPDALNIIALKADGAMRDALSIFDQLVSFAGTKFTYEDVIFNLNVLDYDYYFKISDAFLKNDISNSLLIFNEILDNGFDGHNFIAGLSSHFRDLLVCKDSITHQLLEVGAKIRENYKEQSSLCPAEFLINALNITNNCDINYNNSKNQRLHVELALLQLCNSNLPAGAQKDSLSKTEEKTGDEHKTEQPLPLPSLKLRQAGDTSQGGSQVSKTDTASVKKDVPLKKYESSTLSIKDVLNGKTLKKDDNTEKDIAVDNVADKKEAYGNEDLISSFTQENLQEKWTKFANTIKQSEPRLYNTLTSQNPVMKNNFQIDFTINNQLQEEAIKQIKNKILFFLKDELKNHKIELNTVIAQQESENKLYTDDDKFNYLNTKNPNLSKLKQQFNLDFS